MKKRILTLCMALVLCLSLLTFGASAGGLPSYSGGRGEENDPYKLSTVYDLESLATAVNNGTSYEGVYFVLTADIGDSTTPVTTVIGNSSHMFQGHFDGAGHTVTLAINQTSTDYVGLFGVIAGVSSGDKAEIKNVITAGSVNGKSNVAGVCGNISMNGTITGCSNKATVTGSQFVGGVCGYSNGGVITSCANKATVTGSQHVGGVCGNNNGGTIGNCCSFATVNGAEYVGGVCGGNSGTTKNCCNFGTVDGSNYFGSVCGKNDWNVKDSYYDSTTCSAGSDGGTSLSTDLCKADKSNTDSLVYKLNKYITDNSSSTAGWKRWKTPASGSYPELHDCVYDQCVENDDYLKTPANCVAPGIYYKSCTCGARSTNDVFISSTAPTGHGAWKYNADGNILTVKCGNDGCTESISAFLVLNAADKVYDGNPAAATIGNTDAWKAYFGDDSVPAIEYYDSTGKKLDDAPKDAGTYTAKITAGEVQYAATASVTFYITKAPLIVQAMNLSAAVGDAAPDLSNPVKGTHYTILQGGSAVNNDMVNERLSITLTASPDMDVAGSYDIEPNVTGDAEGNYSITLVNGALTVNTSKTVPIPTGATYIYCGKEQTFMKLPEGTAWDDTTTADYDSSTGDFTGTDVGEYHVVLSLSDSNSTWSNGTKDAKTITFYIDPAPLIIDVKDKTAAVGGTAPDLSAPVSGTDYTFLKGPCSRDLGKITVALDCRNLDMDQAGVYEIQATVGGDSRSNYEVIVATGSLVVTDSAAPYVIGDLNGDGLVNSKDVIILARHVAEWNGYKTLPVLDK